MPAKKHSQLHQWEQTMIDAYYDYQWHLVLDPLYEKFQDWKAGDVSHPEMNSAIHETHKECQKLYILFTSKRDFLIGIIQYDEGWFQQWLLDHPKPDVEKSYSMIYTSPARYTSGIRV